MPETLAVCRSADGCRRRPEDVPLLRRVARIGPGLGYRAILGPEIVSEDAERLLRDARLTMSHRFDPTVSDAVERLAADQYRATAPISHLKIFPSSIGFVRAADDISQALERRNRLRRRLPGHCKAPGEGSSVGCTALDGLHSELVRDGEPRMTASRQLGDSAVANDDFDSATAAEDLHQWIVGLGAGPVHLAAQDIAGGAAYRLAAAHPEVVRTLIATEMGLARLRETIEVLSDSDAVRALAETEPVLVGCEAIRSLVAERGE